MQNATPETRPRFEVFGECVCEACLLNQIEIDLTDIEHGLRDESDLVACYGFDSQRQGWRIYWSEMAGGQMPTCSWCSK
jgi:hypothetical protein